MPHGFRLLGLTIPVVDLFSRASPIPAASSGWYQTKITSKFVQKRTQPAQNVSFRFRSIPSAIFDMIGSPGMRDSLFIENSAPVDMYSGDRLSCQRLPDLSLPRQ